MSGPTKSLIASLPLDLNLSKLNIHISHGSIWIELLFVSSIDVHDGKGSLIASQRDDSYHLLIVKVLVRIYSVLSHSYWIIHVDLLSDSIADSQGIDSSDLLLELPWQNDNIVFIYLRYLNIVSVLIVIGVVLGVVRDQLSGDLVLMRNHSSKKVHQFLGKILRGKEKVHSI